MLPRYGRKGPNSRYRLWQYQPLFQKAGYDVDVKPMLDNTYIERLFAGVHRNLFSLAIDYLAHIGHMLTLKKYDAAVIDQELFPYLPAAFEKFASRLNGRLIVDYDDAAYYKYRRFPVLRAKIGKVMAAARTVVVGNQHLAEYARQFAPDVRLIPTVVDVAKYVPRQDNGHGNIVRACWIGNPITGAEFLPPMVPVFLEAQRLFPNLWFRFIGVNHVDGGSQLRAEFIPWSEATEAPRIAECDIGIMPLRDDEFARGKCGLKLIQYMAGGLPVIASPVGENRHIVEHGLNGFHAGDSHAWIEHLGALISDAGLRHKMGRQGRAKAERQYSLQYGFARWRALIEDLVEEARNGRKELKAVS
jgi:hypothetical protein